MIVNGKNVDVTIIYGQRKTVSIELKTDGIFVRAPKVMSRQKINAFLEEKRSWIEKHWTNVQAQKVVLEEKKPFTMEEIRELADLALIVIPEKVKK